LNLRMHLLTGFQYKGWPIMMLQMLLVCLTDPIGLAETFCRGFDYFPWRMIRTGEFDRVLLRPHSLVVQVAASYFHIHRLSRVLAGMGAIIWCLF